MKSDEQITKKKAVAVVIVATIARIVLVEGVKYAIEHNLHRRAWYAVSDFVHGHVNTQEVARRTRETLSRVRQRTNTVKRVAADLADWNHNVKG